MTKGGSRQIVATSGAIEMCSRGLEGGGRSGWVKSGGGVRSLL
jgi:hypothetical protein